MSSPSLGSDDATRVERIAQAVADEVDREHGKEDRGAWDRNTRGKDIKVSLKPEHQGFIVIAQGRQSGKILAAAEYRTDKKMEDKSENQEKGDDLEMTNPATPPASNGQ